jgi:hypothetical protein
MKALLYARYRGNAKIKLYVSNSHYEDFLSGVRSRKKPVASEQIG